MSFFTTLLGSSPGSTSNPTSNLPLPSNSSFLEDIVGFEIKTTSSKECGKADSIGFSFSYSVINSFNSFNSGTGGLGSSADSDSNMDDIESDDDNQSILSIGFEIVWDILSPSEAIIDLNTCKNFFSSILNNFLTNYI